MPEGSTEHRKLAAIMFTDMVGYCALSQRNEALALELLEEHRCVVRAILPRHGGREVKTTGDGFLIEFPSALAAVHCGIDMQAALHTRNLGQAQDRQTRIRIGIHVGDVVARDGDVHGDGVNLAARIEPLAEPGGICLSRPVHDQVANKAEAPLARLGQAELKNIHVPMEVYRVVLPWQRTVSTGGVPGRTRPLKQTLPWAIAGLALAFGAAALFIARRDFDASSGNRQRTAPLRKLELTLPPPARKGTDQGVVALAISPDGRKLAYANADGVWLRPLDRLAAPVLLTSAENVHSLFWSPQSVELAYAEGDEKLYRIPVAGGRPMLICSVTKEQWLGDGGAWFPNDQVIFDSGDLGASTVSAKGGQATTLIRSAGPPKEFDFHSVSALPGGRGVVFVTHRQEGVDTIEAWTPAGGRKVLLQIPGSDLATPVFSNTGHVLYDRGDEVRGLWAFAFSLAKLERTGEPFRVADEGHLPSVSEDGTLVFTTDESWLSGTRQLVWVERTGRITGTIGSPQPRMTSPRLSPDGSRIAVVSGVNWSDLDIWVFDAGRGSALPLLRNQVPEFEPYWFPDGRRILYSRYTPGGHRRSAFARSADGLGSEEALFDDYAGHLAPAGNYVLLGWQILPGSKRSYISLASTNRASVPFPGPWNSIKAPKLSPDETWMAYESDKDEGGEVCLVSFPGFTNRLVLSRGGGKRPQWHPSGTELFYLGGRTLMSVALKRDGRFQPGEPTKIFDLPDSIYVPSENVESGNPFDVSADGQRFLMMQTVESPGGPRPTVHMVENWFEEFRAKQER